MAYHKSGVTLSTELVGNVVPGPLTRLLLKDPEEKVPVVVRPGAPSSFLLLVVSV